MPEDLSDISDYLDYGGWMNRRLHAGAFARPQERIGGKAREASIPVTYVEPAITSQTCHECGHVGYRNGDEPRCQNEDCRVTEDHADINAAVIIADRVESQRWDLTNPDGDSPRGPRCIIAPTRMFPTILSRH